MPYHVSRQQFARLVERALASLPHQFARALDEDVRIEIRDRPTRKQLRSVGLDEDELLLGLYEGHPITDRSIESTGQMPDVIFIFQEDCELVSDSEQQLIDEVRVTVLHELGHHFGLDEDELDRLGYA